MRTCLFPRPARRSTSYMQDTTYLHVLHVDPLPACPGKSPLQLPRDSPPPELPTLHRHPICLCCCAIPPQRLVAPSPGPPPITPSPPHAHAHTSNNLQYVNDLLCSACFSSLPFPLARALSRGRVCAGPCQHPLESPASPILVLVLWLL